MLKNHVDLDRALEQLKAESATSEECDRAIHALERAKDRASKLPAFAVAALVLAVVGLLALPTRGNGMTFDDVLKQTRAAINIHEQTFDLNGKRIADMWSSGGRYAILYYDQDGKVKQEIRRDGHYLYLYRPNTWRLPNAYAYAQLMKASYRVQSDRTNAIDELLSRKAKLLGHQTVQLGGKPAERYEVLMYRTDRASVDADPGTGRVLQIRLGKYREEFDYPDSIAPGTFSWESRVTKDVPVLDRRDEDTRKRSPPSTPIASAGKVKLLELGIGPTGLLYATWTGERYSRLHLRPFNVIGVKTGKPAYGPAAYTDGRHVIDSLNSISIPLLDKVGDKVSIRIPTGPHSYAVFKDIAVKRLGPLRP